MARILDDAPSPTLKERLTKIRLTITNTSEKNVSARTSFSGMP